MERQEASLTPGLWWINNIKNVKHSPPKLFIRSVMWICNRCDTCCDIRLKWICTRSFLRKNDTFNIILWWGSRPADSTKAEMLGTSQFTRKRRWTMKLYQGSRFSHNNLYNCCLGCYSFLFHLRRLRTILGSYWLRAVSGSLAEVSCCTAKATIVSNELLAVLFMVQKLNKNNVAFLFFCICILCSWQKQ